MSKQYMCDLGGPTVAVPLDMKVPDLIPRRINLGNKFFQIISGPDFTLLKIVQKQGIP